MKVLFLLPVGPGGGGVHSIIQETNEMRALGVDARVAVLRKARWRYEQLYASNIDTESLLVHFGNARSLNRVVGAADVAVATVYHSVAMLKRSMVRWPRIAPAYYVQDYEPFFFPEISTERAAALRSYTDIRGMTLFAKTDWLRGVVSRRHGVFVHKVTPGIDHDIYRPATKNSERSRCVTVSAMIRPRTPRRAAARTMRVLRQVKTVLRDAVRIEIFGVAEEDELYRKLERGFDYRNHGYLDRAGVAAVLGSADIFADLSEYQAFGRTALEAMACGCAVVVPAKGGTGEYARHESNSLVVDTNDEAAALRSLVRLVQDVALRRALAARAVRMAARYTVRAAAQSELAVLEAARASWRAQPPAATRPGGIRRWLASVIADT